MRGIHDVRHFLVDAGTSECVGRAGASLTVAVSFAPSDAAAKFLSPLAFEEPTTPRVELDG